MTTIIERDSSGNSSSAASAMATIVAIIAIAAIVGLALYLMRVYPFSNVPRSTTPGTTIELNVPDNTPSNQ